MEDLDLIGSAEACQLLRIDRSTITRWAEARDGDGPRLAPVMRLAGKRGALLFRRSDVEALAQKRAGVAA